MVNKFARHLRRNQTVAEENLWLRLRQLRPQGYHFRRQVSIDQFIVDFVCFSQRLVIEVDGYQHREPDGMKRDAARDAHLVWRGFKVIRFNNIDVSDNISGVMETVVLELGALNDSG